MKLKLARYAALLALVSLITIATAKTGSTQDDSKPAGTSTQAAERDKAARLEGEKRFHSNCSRCHAAPPKFPPRMMGTIIRHMRVRAMLTNDDTRYILQYMTQ